MEAHGQTKVFTCFLGLCATKLQRSEPTASAGMIHDASSACDRSRPWILQYVLLLALPSAYLSFGGTLAFPMRLAGLSRVSDPIALALGAL